MAPPSGRWTCTFDDEFNGTSLDTAKWLPQLTANSAYTTGSSTARPCYVDTPQTISESGGTLNLSIVRLSKPAFCTALDYFGMTTPYQAGMVSTYKLFSQQYGYFAVRAETPSTVAGGLQETFWLYPQDENLYGGWPDSGEIDFAEFYSYRANKDYPTIHYPGSRHDPNSNAIPDGCAPGGATPAGQFNTYALAWTPTTLTTYFNGEPCFTDTYWPHVTHPDTAPEPFNQPFFLNLTAAMGSGANTLSNDTSFPATTRIDWVRVWQYG